MSRLGALGLGLCFAGGLQAQTTYKCTGADGKTAFSDLPCPSTAAKQETRTAPKAQTGAPAGRVESDAETARRWGVQPADFAIWRRSCSAGDRETCGHLERMKRTEPATKDLVEQSRRQRKEAVNHESALCRGGNQAACDRVQQLLR